MNFSTWNNLSARIYFYLNVNLYIKMDRTAGRTPFSLPRSTPVADKTCNKLLSNYPNKTCRLMSRSVNWVKRRFFCSFKEITSATPWIDPVANIPWKPKAHKNERWIGITAKVVVGRVIQTATAALHPVEYILCIFSRKNTRQTHLY